MDTRGGNAVGALLHNGMTKGGDLPMPFDRCLEDLPLVLAFIVGHPLSRGVSPIHPTPPGPIPLDPLSSFQRLLVVHTTNVFPPTLPFVHLTRLVRSSRSSRSSLVWPSFPYPFFILIDQILKWTCADLVSSLLCQYHTMPSRSQLLLLPLPPPLLATTTTTNIPIHTANSRVIAPLPNTFQHKRTRPFFPNIPRLFHNSQPSMSGMNSTVNGVKVARESSSGIFM